MGFDQASKLAFSIRVKQLYKEYRIKQADLAEKLHISPSALSKYLSPTNPLVPSQDVINSIAEFFKVDPNTLYFSAAQRTTVISVQDELNHLLRAITALNVEIEVNGNSSTANSVRAFLNQWNEEKGNYPSLDQKLNFTDDFSRSKKRYMMYDGQIVSWYGFFKELLERIKLDEADRYATAGLDYKNQPVNNELISRAVLGFEQFLAVLAEQLEKIREDADTSVEIRSVEFKLKQRAVELLQENELKLQEDARKKVKAEMNPDDFDSEDLFLLAVERKIETPLYLCLQCLQLYFKELDSEKQYEFCVF